MENLEKTEKQLKWEQDRINYVNKTSMHLFTLADEEIGNQTFIKVIPFTKDNTPMYAKVVINKDGKVNVRVDTVQGGWLEYHIFHPWLKHKAIPYFKEMRIKMEKVKKMLDEGWTDKTILETAITEVFSK